MGYPVFSSCVIPEGTLKLNPGSINDSVICGGIMVNPGDIIVGDDDGVVVVPAVISENILSQSKAIVAKEKKLKERILSGESIYDILDLQTILDSHEWIIT
jgi:4-hydroxy-4-methyl-2-oxoglutarate aldolase